MSRRSKQRPVPPINPIDVVFNNPYFAMITSHPGKLGAPDERNLYISPAGQVVINNQFNSLIIAGFDLEQQVVELVFTADDDGAMARDLVSNLIDFFLRQNELLVPLRQFRLRHNMDVLLRKVAEWEEEVEDQSDLDGIEGHTCERLQAEIERLMPTEIRELELLDEMVAEEIRAFVDRWSDHVKPVLYMGGRSPVAPL